MSTEKPEVIPVPHCQQCGSTDPEDVGHEAARENDGYSGCCNEIIIWGGDCSPRSCYHGAWGPLHDAAVNER